MCVHEDLCVRLNVFGVCIVCVCAHVCARVFADLCAGMGVCVCVCMSVCDRAKLSWSSSLVRTGPKVNTVIGRELLLFSTVTTTHWPTDILSLEY